MTEQYPYPTAEHYQEPTTPAGVLAEELRLYTDPSDYHERLVGLSEWYGKTPIIRSMQKYAFLMNVARVAAGKEVQDVSGVDIDFNVGALLGIHSMVYNASPNLGKRILSCDPLRYIEGDEDDLVVRQAVVRNLHAWDTEIFEKEFEGLDETLQEQLFDTTKHIYAGIYQPYDREQAFMSGYVFSHSLLRHNQKTPGPV